MFFLHLDILIKAVSHLFEFTPLWIFLIKFPSVVRKKEESEYCKQHTPKGTP